MTHETILTVRYAETDMMGIVHHSNYAVWFEAARTQFLGSLGCSYAEIESKGALLPLTSLECEFKKPARYGHDVVIKTTVDKLTCVRMEFNYEVYHASKGYLIAVGKTKHAWTDTNFKPMNIERKLPELYKMLQTVE